MALQFAEIKRYLTKKNQTFASKLNRKYNVIIKTKNVRRFKQFSHTEMFSGKVSQLTKTHSQMCKTNYCNRSQILRTNGSDGGWADIKQRYNTTLNNDPDWIVCY